MNNARKATVWLFGCCLAIGLCAIAAAADEDLLVKAIPTKPNTGGCFARDYDAAHLRAHRGQTVAAVRLSLGRELLNTPDHTRDLRIELRQHKQSLPFYIVGGCYWDETVNRDVQGKRLVKAFAKDAGVQCNARGGVGGSAEEGGDFPIDMAPDGRSLTLYMDAGVSGWRGPDQTKRSVFLKFGAQDRIFKLERVDNAAYAELDGKVVVD